MWGFDHEILLKNGISTKFEAPNHIVNPDWNFGKMQLVGKSAMSSLHPFIVVPTDILVSRNDIFRVSTLKFVGPGDSFGRLNILLKF